MKWKQTSNDIPFYRLAFPAGKLPESFWQQLPRSPVVYGFEDESKTPIYVGKTVHPVTRIRQHLKANRFIKQSAHLRIYPVVSNLESILLEARLIHLYQPRFNAIQKDDRSYLYIRISRDEWPRVEVLRKNDLKKSEESFGPFTSTSQTKTVLKLARRIFKFCDNPGNTHKRPCFYRHLDLCSGACVGVVGAAEYRKMIGQLKRFLNGQTKLLLDDWKKEINRAARAKDFEVAQEVKDRYDALFNATQVNVRLATVLEAPPRVDQALRSLREVLSRLQLTSDLERIEIYDVATLQQTGTVGAMVVFNLGVKQPEEYRLFKISTEAKGDTGAMREMLVRRMRHSDWRAPDLIVIDGGKGQLSAVEAAVPAGIPIVGLAKREETLVYRKDGAFAEYVLPGGEARKLLQQMRDETHRFVNSFHARRRVKMLLK